jgi:hypothetical protein
VFPRKLGVYWVGPCTEKGSRLKDETTGSKQSGGKNRALLDVPLDYCGHANYEDHRASRFWNSYLIPIRPPDINYWVDNKEALLRPVEERINPHFPVNDFPMARKTELWRDSLNWVSWWYVEWVFNPHCTVCTHWGNRGKEMAYYQLGKGADQCIVAAECC